jgi:preprotein translocase subunit SecE
MDNRKIILSFYFTVSAVLWFLSRAAIQYFYLTFYQIRRLPGISFLKEAAPFVLGIACFLILLNHARANLVLEEVVSELKKVTWPDRQEVVRATTVVIICIMVASFILAGFDLMWGKVISYLLNTRT